MPEKKKNLFVGGGDTGGYDVGAAKDFYYGSMGNNYGSTSGQPLTFGSGNASYFDNYAKNYVSSQMGGNGGADFSKMSSMFGSQGGQGGQGGGKAAGNAAWLQAIPGGLNGWTVAM